MSESHIESKVAVRPSGTNLVSAGDAVHKSALPN